MTQPARRDNLENPARRAGLLVLALVAGVLVAAMLGSPVEPGLAVGSILLKAGASWPAVVYLAAGFGLGWPVVRWCLKRAGPCRAEVGSETPEDPSPVKLLAGGQSIAARCDDSVPIQAAAGLAILVSLSEVLGVLGLLNSVTAIGVCAVGLGLLAWQVAGAVRGGARIQVPGLVWMLACPAVAVLLVAAAMPPGWLWASEYGGFDALSYHLQLPQEWLALGRIAPVEHNVYSYLPGYAEAAFTHLGYLSLAPERGLLGGDGWRLIACQGLHAGLTLAAAWLTARATQRLAMNLGIAGAIARWAGAVAGCVAIATPWAVVTGSLAYNEGGVNAMFAGALLVGVQPGLRGGVRGGLVGLLVGVACGFKPTALFFVGVPAGVVLVAACGAWGAGRPPAGNALAQTPDAERRRGDWPAVRAAIAAGAIVGLVSLSPWLIRNAAHGGNPVFPFATDALGSAHWTEEQVDRYRAAHSFDGQGADRLRTLVWSSPNSEPDDPAVERFRGLANPQWGLVPVFTVLAFLPLLARWPGARFVSCLLALVLISQIACWGGLTHLQSRFLLPMLPLASLVIGLALARLRTLVDARTDGRAGVALLAGLVVAVQTGFLVVGYLGEAGGNLGLGLALFPDTLTRVHDEPPDGTAVGWCNTTDRGGELVLLVGDSTPLYFGPGVAYHTTYDASPLGDLMRQHPDNPAAWASGLRGRGIGWLLVNDSELRRLHASGWYDTLVTPERVHEFTETLGGPARVWPEERRYLVRIPAMGAPPIGGG